MKLLINFNSFCSREYDVIFIKNLLYKSMYPDNFCEIICCQYLAGKNLHGAQFFLLKFSKLSELSVFYSYNNQKVNSGIHSIGV
jgi:hypothetical protein